MEQPVDAINIPKSFPAAERAAARVTAVREENWKLRARLKVLQEQLACAEAEVSSCGPYALAMPEDIGEWTSCGPRIQGIVDRIYQTEAQAAALAGVKSKK
jgi:hypothetical protein